MRIFVCIAFVVFWCGFTGTGFGITPEQRKELPAGVGHPVDFNKEIRPILEKSCANCHGHGRSKGKFRMDNRDTFLKGGSSGPAVIMGNSEESLLIELVMGFDPDSVMPAKGSRLTKEQIASLRAWIDQGALWDTNVWLGKVEAKNLQPVSPNVKPSEKFSNPVDVLVNAYFQTNKIKWPEVVSDRVFARRVYLDLIGLLPPPAELDRFVKDASPDKREKLVDTLLSRNRDYAEHWLTFWNDLLRNDYKGTGYIDGGRKQITKWLFTSLETNKPYNEFVGELVNPLPESEGFAKGIVWRGTVNASQAPQMQAAQSISQVFMGVNLKCASCHDSFVNDWQLADSYALANIYADDQLELFECDKPTGRKAATKFLYPEFGEVDAKADKPTRLKQLAECITSPKNGRLSRTFVNRIWGRFFGHAFVEPVDDMEQAGWNQELLDWLAQDFVAHGYDMKHLFKQMVLSRAYQLPAVNLGEIQKDYVFRGPSVRRLTAEQFRDALTALTGIGYSVAATDVVPNLREKKFAPKVDLKWIWTQTNAAVAAKPEYVYYRKVVNFSQNPDDARMFVVCDNSFILYVNGKKVGEGADYTKQFLFDLRPFLHTGENLVAIEAANYVAANLPPTPENLSKGTDNPAGMIVYARVRHTPNGAAEKVMDFGSDASWTFTTTKAKDWEKLATVSDTWKNAVPLGGVAMQPWRLSANYFASQLSSHYAGDVRAALVTADPLMVALGRPNREQVVTTRPVEATTLQALEMTNGETLSDILKRGAAALTSAKKNSKVLIRDIYRQALGRMPDAQEIKSSEEIVGQSVQKEGVEDFLWAVAMLPEFQLIY